jgi:hypothetical protein
MAAAPGEVWADPFIGNCASLRRELSGEPDLVNLQVRFGKVRGTCSVASRIIPFRKVCRAQRMSEACRSAHGDSLQIAIRLYESYRRLHRPL